MIIVEDELRPAEGDRIMSIDGVECNIGVTKYTNCADCYFKDKPECEKVPSCTGIMFVKKQKSPTNELPTMFY